MKNRTYICIDLKSFYASVECVERNLEPLNTNLVVADKSRTEKTICLAVTPSLKSYGIGGRCRLFEVNSMVNRINKERMIANNYRNFTGKSYLDNELKNNKNLKLDFLVAPPRMSLYMKYSSKIFSIYLKYISKDDIYPYSIDEVFCDVTTYLKLYNLTPEELATKILKDVYDTTGITATAGIGTNMFLAKVAMDVVAKHKEANSFGVRIASLDEMTYRKLLWHHKPITDIWRVGRGTAKRLEKLNIYTMGDLARYSIENENKLFKEFGVNAELLIDHAWGYEPCTMEMVKKYKPMEKSINNGQVFHCPTDYIKTKLIVKEMADQLSLQLVEKNYLTDRLVLTIGYDVNNLTNNYRGEVVVDYLGRKIPKPAHGTINLEYPTSSTMIITKKIVELFDKIIDKKLLCRRMNISACRLVKEDKVQENRYIEQVNLFDMDKDEEIKSSKKEIAKEKDILKVMLDIKKKYGKNAILRGMNLEEGATQIERNSQVGGHHE